MKLLLLASDPVTLMNLTRHGPAHGWHVVTANSLAELHAVEGFLIPDLILVEADYLYSELGERIRRLRDLWNTPAILSINSGEVRNYSRYLLEEFEDFVSLPVHFDELLMRLRLLVGEILNQSDVLHMGPLVVDKRAHQVNVDGDSLALTPKQYELLYLLMEKQGDLLTNEEICSAVWPDSKRVATSDVQQFVFQLRRRLRSRVGERIQIENQRGFGYRLIANTVARSG